MTKLYDGSTYAAADTYLGKKYRRPTNHKNTYLYREPDGTIIVVYYGTTIIRYYRDGSTQIRAAGYRTVTTKERINYFSKAHVVQHDYTWYVLPPYSRYPNRWDHRIGFFDGMYIDAEGMPI